MNKNDLMGVDNVRLCYHHSYITTHSSKNLTYTCLLAPEHKYQYTFQRNYQSYWQSLRV